MSKQEQIKKTGICLLFQSRSKYIMKLNSLSSNNIIILRQQNQKLDLIY